MSSGTMFIIAVLVVAVISVLAVFRSPSRIQEYFSTKEGKGVLWGIVLFIGFGVAVVLASKAFGEEAQLHYLQYGSVYLGLDNTNHQSPMCEEGDNSSRLTSNGGVRVNLLESSDERFSTNLKYTHHSCAFNADDESYDALGLEVEYKFWER